MTWTTVIRSAGSCCVVLLPWHLKPVCSLAISHFCTFFLFLRLNWLKNLFLCKFQSIIFQKSLFFFTATSVQEKCVKHCPVHHKGYISISPREFKVFWNNTKHRLTFKEEGRESWLKLICLSVCSNKQRICFLLAVPLAAVLGPGSAAAPCCSAGYGSYFIKERLGQLAKRHAVIVPPAPAILKDNNFL